MNDAINPESGSTPPPLPASNPTSSGVEIPYDWRSWARRLLVCNPFFLCSAALLLFGVNRLSLDPNFLAEDQSNLLFNYSALQLYGFLVAGTAIVLARRKIWYDSALLVVVENGLVLVPFMLISQGALLKDSLGMILAIGAVGLTALRALGIRRWYPQFNLPSRVLAFGAVLLLVNASLPLVFPRMVDMDTDDWAAPNLFLWYVVFPFFVAGANLLPRPTRYGGFQMERSWLPLFIYTLWVTGTGVHFWSLAHISNVPFQLQHLGPAFVVAAWTMYRRVGDCVLVPEVKWQRALLGLTFAAPLISFGNPELFESLVMFNALGFAFLFLRSGESTRTFAREMLVLCLLLAAFGLPEEIGRLLIPRFVRAQGLLLGLSLLILIYALRWFRTRLALMGAVAAMVLVTLIWPAAPLHAFLETGLLFLLTHSLAWRSPGRGAKVLRLAAGIIWIVDAAMWVHDYPWRTDVSVTAAAFILLAAWFAIWRASKQRPDLIVACSAMAVMLCAPTDWLVRNGSAGLVAMVSSLALFGIGFAVAWTRQRWHVAP